MVETTGRIFMCHRCGQQFEWKPEFAGRKFACGCGNVMQVPLPPPPDEQVTYKLAPEHSGVKPENSAAIAAELVAAGAARRVVAYQSPCTRTAEPLDSSGDRRRDLYVPIGLVVFGGLFTIAKLCWGVTTASEIARALAQVIEHFGWEIIVTLVAIIVASKMLDVSFGTIGSAILKLGAISIGPLGLWYLVWLVFPNDSGGAVGYMLSVLLYCGLFAYLFELDFRETLICVTVATIFRWLSYLLFWGVL